MAHLLPRKAGARRARDRDVWSTKHEGRLGQCSCVMAREGTSRHSVPAGSAQHTPLRTLLGSVMTKKVSLSTDLQCEEHELSELEESASRRLHNR